MNELDQSNFVKFYEICVKLEGQRRKERLVSIESCILDCFNTKIDYPLPEYPWKLKEYLIVILAHFTIH